VSARRAARSQVSLPAATTTRDVVEFSRNSEEAKRAESVMENRIDNMRPQCNGFLLVLCLRGVELQLAAGVSASRCSGSTSFAPPLEVRLTLLGADHLIAS
jgi:hypothetical protein